MAELRNGYWVELVPGERVDGSLAVTLLAKRTFRIPQAEPVVEPLDDDEQPPLLDADQLDGDPQQVPPTLEHELAAEKARVDVIVLGHAVAPGGKAQPAFDASIRVGSTQVTVRVHGPRTARWRPPKKRQGKLVPQPPVFTRPEPVAEVPLTMTLAYGGKTRVIPDDETLKLQRAVAEQMQTEADEEAAQGTGGEQGAASEGGEAKRGASGQGGADQAAEDVDLEALFADGRARTDDGFDDDGVRLADTQASRGGTQVLDLAELQAADGDTAGGPTGDKRGDDGDSDDDGRRHARGDHAVDDEGVAVLTAEALAEAIEAARKDQQAWRDALREAAGKRRGKERDAALALAAEGHRLDDDGWAERLREALTDEDAKRLEARRKRIEAQRKALEEKLAEFPELPCPTNPFGLGFVVSNVQAMVDGLPLPQFEDPNAPLTPADLIRDLERLDEVPMPAGFGVLPRMARSRVALAGAYPSERDALKKLTDQQMRELDLDDPEQVRALKAMDGREVPAMQAGFFNCAPPALQLAAVHGDEEIVLEQLGRKDTWRFRLPGKALIAELDRGAGVEREDMQLDTVCVDTEKAQVSLRWRAHFPLTSMDALGVYPHLVGHVLDLDLEDKRRRDDLNAAKRKREGVTEVLNLEQLEAFEAEEAKRRAAALQQASGGADADLDKTALQIAGMGGYLQADADAGWVDDAGDATDPDAAEASARAEAAFAEKKAEAVAALDAKDEADAARRAEIAAAVQAGKKVPPKGSKKAAKLAAKAASKTKATRKK